jgi:hypothetical protein
MMGYFGNMEQVMNCMAGHGSEKLAASPLFELLFGSDPTVNPPAMYNTNTRPLPGKAAREVNIDFTAKDFVTMCKDIKISYLFDGSENHETH